MLRLPPFIIKPLIRKNYGSTLQNLWFYVIITNVLRPKTVCIAG